MFDGRPRLGKGLIGLLLLTLAACAAVDREVPRPLAESPVPPPREALRNGATALPGAELGDGEPLSIRYPGEVLFATGAALPLAGGTVLLEPLAQWLAAAADVQWQGTVRAAGGLSVEYDRQLAAVRAELLGRYFTNRGIARDRLELQAEAGTGAPFELRLKESAAP